MKYLLAFVLLLCCYLSQAQNSYTAIGATASWYIPETSKPTYYTDDNAFSTGIFGERYFNNHFKLKLGVNYFYNTFKDKYIDTSERPKIFAYDAAARFITVPFEVSYNFMREDAKWEFFIDASYVAFIHYKTTIKDFNGDYPLTHYDKNVSYGSEHYFSVGISGRYKFSNGWITGFGTKSYHFLPVIDKTWRGFPTLSIDVSMGYAF